MIVPHALLFNVAVLTMRKSIHVRSSELRKTGEEPRHVFNLTGRSDLACLFPETIEVCRMNIKFVIEVKVKGFRVVEALKEAYLQLVGLNVDNMNTSPAVILTDLDSKHYVLWLDIVDYTTLKFKLCIHSFSDLRFCIESCRALSERPCITSRFGSPPMPLTSLRGGSSDADDDDEETSSLFGKCSLIGIT